METEKSQLNFNAQKIKTAQIFWWDIYNEIWSDKGADDILNRLDYHITEAHTSSKKTRAKKEIYKIK